jgi:hypothetical protein
MLFLQVSQVSSGDRSLRDVPGHSSAYQVDNSVDDIDRGKRSPSQNRFRWKTLHQLAMVGTRYF